MPTFMLSQFDHFGQKGAMYPKLGASDITKSLASTIEQCGGKIFVKA